MKMYVWTECLPEYPRSQFSSSYFQGNLLLAMKQPEAAVSAFRSAQELRPDIRSYQGAAL